MLVSKIQSAVTSSGNELEELISDSVQNIDDFDKFLQRGIIPDEVSLARKQHMKNSRILHFEGSEPDFMIVRRREGKQNCYIVELKDGHVFDTKKVDAELEAMRAFAKLVERRCQFKSTVSYHFCAFNQNNKKEIRKGFKNKITDEQAMTGKEFCELLKIDYGNIIEKRRGDGSDNVEFLLSELIRISSVRERLRKLLIAPTAD